LPSAACFYKYHRDEAHYTDAALLMTQSGDYLTPRWSNGRPRFYKPIYTYWLVLTGFAVGGPGLLASRIPFLLLTTLVVWLTFVLARRVYGRSETALLAAVLLLTNVLFMDCSGHALPDTPLLAGMTLSHFGFVSLLLLRRRSWREYLCAYGGAGLAVGSKGLPGLLPVFFALLFIAWAKRRRRKQDDEAPSFRVLWHAPAVAAGLTIGLWWYIVAYGIHGNVFLDDFMGDQLVRKVEGSRWWANLPIYILFSFGSFLPWVLLLIPRFRRGKNSWRSLSDTGRSLIVYALGFAVLAILVYTPGNSTYERYMLPSVPLLAIGLAGLLLPDSGEREEGKPIPWLSGAFHIVVVAVTLLSAVFALLAWRQGFIYLASGFGMVIGGGVVLWLVVRWRPATRAVAFGAFLMLLSSVYENQIRTTYRSSPAPGIVSALRSRGESEVVLVRCRRGLANQIRLASGGTLRVEERGLIEAAADPACRLLIFPERCKEQLTTVDWEIARVDSWHSGGKLPGLTKALRRGRAADYLEQRREWFWLAERRDRTEGER